MKLSILILTHFQMAIVVALSCFARLLKPVFSIRSFVPFLMSDGITSFTLSPVSLCSSQWVTVFAKFFSCSNCGWPYSSEYVLFLRNQFKMFWVTTGSIPTKVIQLFLSPNLNRSTEKCIYNSMNSSFMTTVKSETISTVIFRSLPVPAILLLINNNVPKESFVFLFIKDYLKKFHMFLIPDYRMNYTV